MRRLIVSLSGMALVFGFIAAPSASAQQSVNFYLGGFTPRALDARPNEDVLVANGAFLSTENKLRGIDINEFNHVTVGGEWLFAMTRNVEGGLGIGFYQKSVPTVYTDSTHENGTDIVQTLKLRIIPFTATVRFLPLGRDAAIQPYIGGGVGVFAWRYSETGEFVDVTDSSIFRDSFSGSGATAGPVVLGGVGVPIGSWSVGFEIRYQSGQGELPTDQGFAGTKIDLGGFNYLASFKVRF